MSSLFSPTAPASIADSSLPAAQPSVRARLDAATMAILQTRDHVSKALDKHLQELHALRRALGEGDTSLTSLLPATPRATTLPIAAAADFTSSRPQPPAFHEQAPIIQPAPAPLFPDTVPLVPPTAAPIGLEKATLEELNAALAFAFAHVSNAQRVPQPPAFTRR